MMTKWKTIVIFMLLVCLTACSKVKVKHPSVQEYVAGQGNIKGDVNTAYFSKRDKSFEIGANEEGYAVFKQPEEAFKVMREKYSDGLAVIQSEFKLDPVSQKNYQAYKTYGWQVTTGSTEEKEQARFVTFFFDIYENSFN